MNGIRKVLVQSKNLDEHHIWASKLHAAILKYARAANATIIARISGLPRELRDSIYICLFDISEGQDPSRDLLYWWECFDQPWFQLGGEIRASPWLTTDVTGIRPPHFVDPNFMGEKGVREILEAFRAVLGKDMRPNGDKNAIAEFALMDESANDFVEKDVFGVGITMQTITDNLDLCVNFQCDSIDYEQDDISLVDFLSGGSETIRSSTENNSTREHARIRQQRVTLRSGITALCTIPSSSRTVVVPRRVNRPRVMTIVIRQECSSYRALVAILALVHSLYYSLKEKGFVLKVRYLSEEIGLKLLFEEDVCDWSSENWLTNFTTWNTSRVIQSTENVPQQRLVWSLFENMMF